MTSFHPTLATMGTGGLILLIILGLAGLIVFGIIVSFFSVWLRAWLADAYVGFPDLIAMRLRQVPYGSVVDARITAKKAGINIPINDIEAHFLAGGNVVPTIHALIAARKAGIEMDWNRACAIDLATKGSGKSVVEAVRTSVDPKVIDCPNPTTGRITIDGVAKDGIQVKVRARVTVRTNLDRFVGGAKEDTIIARVGEGIVTTIGSAESYKNVLESPDSISKVVLKRGLDVGTAKVTAEEARGVPHHCVDIRTPDQPFSVADYVALAGQAMVALAEKLLAGEEISTPLDLGVNGYGALEFKEGSDLVLEGQGWIVITADNVDSFGF